MTSRKGAVELAPVELALVVLGFVLSAAYAWGLEERPPSDVADYRQLAINLLQGQGYVLEPGFRAYRPPGIVLWLAAIYGLFGPGRDEAVRLVQAVLFSLLVLMGYRVACRLVRPIFAFAFGFVLATSHELIFWVAKPATEFLYTFLLLAACSTCLLWAEKPRSGRSLAAGAFLGLAALTRPVAFGILPFWLAAQWLRASVRHALLGFLGFAAVVSPWLVRNTLVLGRPVITTNSGITLWWANHPDAKVGGWYASIQPNPGPYVWLRQGMSEVEINDRLTREALSFIRERPGRFLRLALGRIGFLLLGYEVRLTNVPFDRLEFFGTFRVRLVLWNAVWLGLAAVGIAAAIASRDPRWYPMLAILAGSLAVHFVYTAVPRMRVPLLPYLFLWGVYGFQLLWDKLGPRGDVNSHQRRSQVHPPQRCGPSS